MKKLAIAAFIFLAGCAAVGNLAIDDKSKVDQIKIGVTTKGQVQELIGSPMTVYFGAEGLETWSYHIAHASVNPAAMVPVVGIFANRHNTESTSLVLMFSDDGIVKKMAYTEPTYRKETPLVNEIAP